MPTNNNLPTIGTVDKLSETVLAYGSDGSIRTLKAGDPIFQGDTVHVLSPTGNAIINLNDGTPLYLGGGTKLPTENMLGVSTIPDPTTETPPPVAQAPTTEGEAEEGSGEENDEGHDHVRLAHNNDFGSDFNLPDHGFGTGTFTQEFNDFTEDLLRFDLFAETPIIRFFDNGLNEMTTLGMFEDTPQVFFINITIPDMDGSETINTVLIEGLPPGVTIPFANDLGGGTHLIPAGTFPLGTSEVTLAINLIPILDSDVDFEIDVTVTTLNEAGLTATGMNTLNVILDAVADEVDVEITNAPNFTLEDTSFEIEYTAEFGDFMDGSESHAIFMRVPTGWTLTANNNPGWALFSSNPSLDTYLLNVTGTLTPIGGNRGEITVDVELLPPQDADDDVDIFFRAFATENIPPPVDFEVFGFNNTTQDTDSVRITIDAEVGQPTVVLDPAMETVEDTLFFPTMTVTLGDPTDTTTVPGVNTAEIHTLTLKPPAGWTVDPGNLNGWTDRLTVMWTWAFLILPPP